MEPGWAVDTHCFGSIDRRSSSKCICVWARCPYAHDLLEDRTRARADNSSATICHRLHDFDCGQRVIRRVDGPTSGALSESFGRHGWFSGASERKCTDCWGYRLGRSDHDAVCWYKMSPEWCGRLDRNGIADVKYLATRNR